MIFETERLYLREMEQSDFSPLCKILMDRDVMYAYEHAFSNEEAQEWLDRQRGRYQKDGFGLWAVVLKDTDEMIGQCGLTIQDYEGKQVVEVGYLLQKAFWSRGYATEAAKACRDYAFYNLNIPEVYSIIRDNNAASIEVAKRNGMTERASFVKHYYGLDMPHLVFSVKRQEKRNSVLYIAMSLDGYIADPSGDVSWLGGENPEGTQMGSYPEFIQTVDTVVMGYRTYHQIVTELSRDAWYYEGMQTYVLTHRNVKDQNEISFVSEPAGELIRRLKRQQGKDIWICGGADIIGQLILADEIDRYHITVIPVLLGDGIRLFQPGFQKIDLKLIAAQSYNGMTDLIYERRS